MKKYDKFTKILIQGNIKKEKNWDNRFVLEKIPQYDAFKDPNYLSLSLMKAKTKLDTKNNSKKKAESLKKKRLYTSRYSINSKTKKAPSQSKINYEESFTEKNNDNIDKKRPTSIYLKRNHLSFMNNLNNNQNSNLESNQKQKIFYNYISNKLKNKNNENYSINDENNKFTPKTTKNNDIKTLRNYIKFRDNSNDNLEKNNALKNDENLLNELKEIKEIWEDICVSSEYQSLFEEMINSLNSKEKIQNLLYNEKRQVAQFESDLSKLMNVISKREKTIEKIKKLDKIFIQNRNLVELNKIMNEKNKSAPNLESNDEKINNFDELKEKNKKEIENDINNCLKILRINSINVVHQFHKFHSINNYLITSDKIDINKFKKKYGYNKEYLLEMKNDLDFLISSNINQIYNFKINDPFLINLIPDKNYSEKNEKYKKVMASEELMKTINNSLFILAQEELLFKMKIKKELKRNKTSEIEEKEHKNNNIEVPNKNNNKEKKNINFVKLHSNKEYNKLFFQNNKNSDLNLDLNNKNNNLNNNRIKKIKNLYFNNPLRIKNEDNQKYNEIPKTTAAQLQKKFDFYNQLKFNLNDNKEEENENTKNEKNICVVKDNNGNDIKNQNQLNENKYKYFWYKDTFNKFKNLYNEYYQKLSQKTVDTFNTSKIPDKFINGMNPKIIICQNDESKIYGVCGINYYNDNNKLILKINHLSSLEKDEDKEDKLIYPKEKLEYKIYDNFMELIKTLPYEAIELTISINQKNIDILNYFFNEHKFEIEKKDGEKEEDNNNEKKDELNEEKNKKDNNNNSKCDKNILETKILRLYNSNFSDDEELNKLKESNEIKYFNTSILSIGEYSNNKNNNNNEIKEDTLKININKYFYKYINTFNLILIFNSLSKNNLYSITNTNNCNITSFSDIVSKYNELFIKDQKININDVSDIFPECIFNTNNDNIRFTYITSIFNSKVFPFTSLIYKTIKYNVFRIKFSEYLEKSIYKIESPDKKISFYIYQCDKIKKEIQKNNINFNIFEYFNKNIINGHKSETNENKDKNSYSDDGFGNDIEKEKYLWVPSFCIDTQFICDKLPIVKDINIKSNEDKILEIKEYNEILKISYGYKEKNNNDFIYEPDLNKQKDIIIDDDFIFAVSHQDIKNQFNNSIIFLTYISKDNFIYTN